MLTSQPCFHVHLANLVTVKAKIPHQSGLSHLSDCVSECGEKDFQKAAPTATSTNQADDKTSSAVTTQDKTEEPAKKIAVDLDQDDADDPLRRMQRLATQNQTATWGHWGNQPEKYMTWDQHSNRLIPVYTFGITLDNLRAEGSAYADPERLKKLYGKVPEGTLNPKALYFDQTDVFRLQTAAGPDTQTSS